jgi:hypothetical protein
VGCEVLDEASIWDSGKLLDLKAGAWSGKQRTYRMRTLQGHELQRALHLPRFGQHSVSEWLDLPYFILMVFCFDGDGGRVEAEIHRIFRAVATKRGVT